MSDIVWNARTKNDVEHFLTNPAHALLLTGVAGSGKTFVAEHIAAKVLQTPYDKLFGHPYFTKVTPTKNAISIDDVRTLQRFMQLKTIGTNNVRRVAIIEHAHTMSTEAQNALLKLLEEPPADTVLILTAHNSRALLTTIRSRLQTIAVQAPGPKELEAAFAQTASSPAFFAQQLRLSGGLPGLLYALLNDESHPLAAGIQTAKELLQGDTFSRLATVENLAKQKDAALTIFEALERIAQAGLDQAAAKNVPRQIKQWHHILKVAHETSAQLASNASAKLALTNAMLQL
ncbi:MAG TPA: AAA family ATPase [Candidatus Saccharimonadales bacterium]